MNKEDKHFIEGYENLLNKGYCNCNEMNCIDNNSPRRILNIVKQLEQENQQLKEQRQELRSWLEDEIKETDRHTTTLDIFNTYDYETIHEMETKKITYKNVLSKLNELEG